MAPFPPPGTLSKDPETDRSLRHSLADGMYFSAMIGSAESYFSAFAVLLRATPTQIGVLAAVPPLLASFTQLASARLGRRLAARRRLIVAGALLQAAALVPLAVLPLLFPAQALPVLIACAVVYFVGPNIGSPHWGSLMGDLVPESRRGRFFALRTRISSLAHFSALIVAGCVLEAFDALDRAWAGFVVIFGLAALFRARSAWHLWRMHEPPRSPANADRSWFGEVRAGYAAPQLRTFSLFFATMQFAVALASPFFALYMLRDLQFGYVAFMFNTAASVAVQFLTLARWGRVSDLFGNRLILVTTGVLIPVLPALWLLSTNYVWLLAVQVLSGLCWAGFTLSATNTIYDLTPRETRTSLMATHNVLAAAGVFAGAVVGGWLGATLPTRAALGAFAVDWSTPLYGVFLISTLARAIVAAAFLPRLKEARRVRPMTRRGLIFRVTRLSPVSAAVFEVVGRAPREGVVRKEPVDRKEDGARNAGTADEEGGARRDDDPEGGRPD